MSKRPEDNDVRVYRGGSTYNDELRWVRAASLDTSEPVDRFSDLGFRCALRGREPRV